MKDPLCPRRQLFGCQLCWAVA